MDETRGYYIEGVLGTGGFGKVYLAEFRGPAQFTKRVAIKLLAPRPDMHPEIEARLRDEGRMLGLLEHPNIVQVSEITRLDGRWAVVMEYVRGLDLAYLLDAVDHLPLGPALECVEEVAKALHHAHAELSLLHRDIKPSNILLTPFGKIKVLDFGIARAAFPDREAETSSLFFGTPSYAAPEAFELLTCHGSDLYALGAVLYELLSGTRFGRTSADSVKHRLNVGERMKLLHPLGLPDDVVAFVRDALSFAPEARPDAKTFEQRATALRRAHANTTLSEWLETRPGVFSADLDLDRDELCGRLMTDQTNTAATPAPQELVPPPEIAVASTPQPTRALGPTIAAGAALIAVGVGIALALSMAGGVATWYALSGSPQGAAVDLGSDRVPAVRPDAADDAAPPLLEVPGLDLVDDAVVDDAAVDDAAVDEGVPRTPAVPVSIPMPPAPVSRPVQPRSEPRAPEVFPVPTAGEGEDPAPVPEVRTPVHFTASDRVSNLFLIGPGGQRYDLPARVPSGDYELRTMYAGATASSPVGNISVGSERLEVSCNLTGRSCFARPSSTP